MNDCTKWNELPDMRPAVHTRSTRLWATSCTRSLKAKFPSRFGAG